MIKKYYVTKHIGVPNKTFLNADAIRNESVKQNKTKRTREGKRQGGREGKVGEIYHRKRERVWDIYL